MDIVFILLPLALLLVLCAVGGFIWAVKRGQFDDVETPALRMLVDDEIDQSAEIYEEDHNEQ